EAAPLLTESTVDERPSAKMTAPVTTKAKAPNVNPRWTPLLTAAVTAGGASDSCSSDPPGIRLGPGPKSKAVAGMLSAVSRFASAVASKEDDFPADGVFGGGGRLSIVRASDT